MGETLNIVCFTSSVPMILMLLAGLAVPLYRAKMRTTCDSTAWPMRGRH